MEKKILQEILLQAPFGYAHHQVICNLEGVPKDYIFLDVNPAYEEMTGLKKEIIIGKKVTEVIPNIKEDPFDWIKFYGQIALNKGREEFVQYFTLFKRWYKITAFSWQKGFFITYVQDISTEMRKIELLERQQETIAQLTRDMERIFNGTNDAVFLVKVENGEYRYLRTNRVHQELTGFSFDTIRGKTPVELVGKELGEVIEANYRKCSVTKDTISYEERLILPGGERIWYTSLTPVVEKGIVKYIVGSSKDITLQKKAEQEKEELFHRLLLEKELLRTTLQSIGDGVVTTDQNGWITSMNKVAEEISGWQEEEVINKPFEQIFRLYSEETGKKVENPVEKVLQTGKIVGLANHTVLITKDGRQVPIADSAAPIRNEKGKTFGVVMVFRDVAREKEWQEKILYLSYHDTLTGLYNRRFMEEELKRQELKGNLPISIIMADVNGLKLANDVFGHAEGDRILQKAAEVIKRSCRKEDVVCRWGGDEFLVLLPKTSAKIAEEIIKRIQVACLDSGTENIRLSIALGCATKETPGKTLNEVITEAEESMYRQKLNERKNFRNTIINTLLSTLFAKSVETEEHAQRIKGYCLQMGEKIKLTSKEMEELSLLAILHDIGKVGIREEILKKSGPLTAAEWEEIKKHPVIGCRIAQNTPELGPIAEYILHHHERWDGQGYPEGLKGENIPLLCRMLAVADAYDAMTSDRPYRKAFPREKALEEIRKNAGSQFDPVIVELFLDIIGNIEIEEDEEQINFKGKL